MTRRPLVLLTCLYVVQGLPFGFQASALGPYLRSEGVSLAAIGLAGALAAPWSLKLLWAPFVDVHGSARFGRRRSWIVPMQVLLALACAVAAGLPARGALGALLTMVLLMNLFAATMDVAVDGLAIDLLRDRDLGRGNAAQVVGFKAGMLLGGGLLVWASQWIGWSGLFAAIAAIVLAVCALTIASPEPPATARAHTSARDVLRTLRGALASPGALVVMLVVATYKLGESLIDPMFGPLLVDGGYTREQIGLYVGVFGMAASITGSLAGGVLATRVPLERALLAAGTLRVIPLTAQLAVALLGVPTPELVIAITVAEHLFGGALTTVMFAFMMSRVDRRIGATHFTLLATVEVLGKTPFSLASGMLAEQLGFSGVFAIGVLLSIAWLVLVGVAQRSAAVRSPIDAPEP